MSRLTTVPAPDGGTYLCADGVVQSHVHPDPRRLVSYFRDLANEVEYQCRPGPLSVLHLGVGGGTFARYLDAVRPGCDHMLVDSDPRLARFVRRRLPGIPTLHGPNHHWTVDTAERFLARFELMRWDLIVVDLFTADRQHVMDLAPARRRLTPGGVLLHHAYHPLDGHSVTAYGPPDPTH